MMFKLRKKRQKIQGTSLICTKQKEEEELRSAARSWRPPARTRHQVEAGALLRRRRRPKCGRTARYHSGRAPSVALFSQARGAARRAPRRAAPSEKGRGPQRRPEQTLPRRGPSPAQELKRRVQPTDLRAARVEMPKRHGVLPGLQLVVVAVGVPPVSHIVGGRGDVDVLRSKLLDRGEAAPLRRPRFIRIDI